VFRVESLRPTTADAHDGQAKTLQIPKLHSSSAYQLPPPNRSAPSRPPLPDGRPLLRRHVRSRRRPCPPAPPRYRSPSPPSLLAAVAYRRVPRVARGRIRTCLGFRSTVPRRYPLARLLGGPGVYHAPVLLSTGGAGAVKIPPSRALLCPRQGAQRDPCGGSSIVSRSFRMCCGFLHAGSPPIAPSVNAEPYKESYAYPSR
jgi:hypothetical protein